VPPGSHLRDLRRIAHRGAELALGRRSFYLRTGKRLPAREAHIVVNFREVPHPIFPGASRANKLVIKLQPEDGPELHLMAAQAWRAAATSLPRQARP
jgi:glucose-6-phosphate 1-dehydrogenase